MKLEEIEYLIEKLENTTINTNVRTVANCINQICQIFRALNVKDN